MKKKKPKKSGEIFWVANISLIFNGKRPYRRFLVGACGVVLEVSVSMKLKIQMLYLFTSRLLPHFLLVQQLFPVLVLVCLSLSKSH